MSATASAQVCVPLGHSSLYLMICFVRQLASDYQWRSILTGGPWTHYIKGPIPHFEFTEEFIIIKVLTKITI